MVIAVSEDFTNVSLYVSQVPQLLKKAFWPSKHKSFYRNSACCKTVKISGFQGPSRTWDPLCGFLYHSQQEKKQRFRIYKVALALGDYQKVKAHACIGGRVGWC